MSYIEALNDPDVQPVPQQSNIDLQQQDDNTNNKHHLQKDKSGALQPLQSYNKTDVQHLHDKPFIGEWCKMFGLDCTTATYLDSHHYTTGDDIAALEVDDIISMDLDGTQKGLLRVASLLYRHTRPSRDKQLASSGVKIIWTTPKEEAQCMHPLDGASVGSNPLKNSDGTEDLRQEQNLDTPHADSVKEVEQTDLTTDLGLPLDVADISVDPEIIDVDQGRLLMENAIKKLEADLLAEKIQLNMILDRSSPDVAAIGQDGIIDIVRGRQLMEEAVRKVVEELLTEDEILLIMSHHDEGSSDVDRDDVR